ncbi:MAG TPA: hypothetical protein VJK05_01700 [archaeon]|nr:hypothetical protein [archaeon]
MNQGPGRGRWDKGGDGSGRNRGRGSNGSRGGRKGKGDEGRGRKKEPGWKRTLRSFDFNETETENFKRTVQGKINEFESPYFFIREKALQLTLQELVKKIIKKKNLSEKEVLDSFVPFFTQRNTFMDLVHEFIKIEIKNPKDHTVKYEVEKELGEMIDTIFQSAVKNKVLNNEEAGELAGEFFFELQSFVQVVEAILREEGTLQ